MSMIKDQVVVITGASSGLGEATAYHLSKLGAKVFLGARREDKLKQVVNKIKEAGGEAEYAVTDVTVKSEVENLIHKAVEKFSKIDVIVNNAGLMAIAPMTENKVDEWEKMIDINIKGVLYGISYSLPHFLKQGHGHIINLSSVAGIKVFAPGGTVYSGTKYAVRAISDGLRQEIAGKNIRVTSIEPGAVDSELKYGSTDKASSDFVIEFYKSAIPAESVAKAIAYAIEQPKEVGINEIVLRPTSQEF
ncbi:SDR family oxidoreductase [Apibacter raozihei]|uniref:SDR family oxidoreductase n=1 Tax=Apibacter TaxID=1778601 RepID=UPI000FE2AF51|nr:MULTISPECIES: SDR family oxidoreductase [Apibacter]